MSSCSRFCWPVVGSVTMFFMVSVCFSNCLQVVQVVCSCFSLSSAFHCWFSVDASCSRLCATGVGSVSMFVMVCFFVFNMLKSCLFERLGWFGSAPACCSMLQFVCKRGRSQFVRLFGFALFGPFR